MINNMKPGQQNDTYKDVGWSEQKKDQLLTIRQFCFVFPWPSESAMRAYVYRADEMGISEAFIRVNRRVLVDPAKFFSLIKQIDNRFNPGGKYETMCCYKGTNHS